MYTDKGDALKFACIEPQQSPLFCRTCGTQYVSSWH